MRTTRAVPRANLSGVELRRFVREREVLAELATGFSNRVVAQRLVLSQRAVEKHINSIFAKLGLTVDDSLDRRVKAVLMFLDESALA